MNAPRNKDEQIMFGIAPDGNGDGVPILIIGIPQAAWAFMASGERTHTFDLTRVGVGLKALVFGSATHETARAEVMKGIAESGAEMTVDATAQDFTLKDQAEAHATTIREIAGRVVPSICQTFNPTKGETVEGRILRDDWDTLMAILVSRKIITPEDTHVEKAKARTGLN